MRGVLLLYVIILSLELPWARSVRREIVELVKSIKDKYDIDQTNDEEFFNILGIKYDDYKDKLMVNKINHDELGHNDKEYDESERNMASMEYLNFKDHDSMVIFWGDRGFEEKYFEESDYHENSKDAQEQENLWREEEENDEIEKEIEAEYEDKVENEEDGEDEAWDTNNDEENIDEDMDYDDHIKHIIVQTPKKDKYDNFDQIHIENQPLANVGVNGEKTIMDKEDENNQSNELMNELLLQEHFVVENEVVDDFDVGGIHIKESEDTVGKGKQGNEKEEDEMDQENEEDVHVDLSGERKKDLKYDLTNLEDEIEEEKFFEKYNNNYNFWEDENNVNSEDENDFKIIKDAGWEEEKRKIQGEGSMSLNKYKSKKLSEEETSIEEEEDMFLNSNRVHGFENNENNIEEEVGDFFEKGKVNNLEEDDWKVDNGGQFFENDEDEYIWREESNLEEENREYFQHNDGEIKETDQDNKQDGKGLGMADTIYFKELESNIEEDRNIYSVEDDDTVDEDDETSFFVWEDDYDTNKEDEDFGVVDYLEEIKLKDEEDKSDRQLYEDVADDDHAEMDYEPDDEIEHEYAD